MDDFKPSREFKSFLFASVWLLPWVMAYGVMIWATTLIIPIIVSALLGLPLLIIGFAPQVIVVRRILKKTAKPSN